MVPKCERSSLVWIHSMFPSITNASIQKRSTIQSRSQKSLGLKKGIDSSKKKRIEILKNEYSRKKKMVENDIMRDANNIHEIESRLLQLRMMRNPERYGSNAEPNPVENDSESVHQEEPEDNSKFEVKMKRLGDNMDVHNIGHLQQVLSNKSHGNSLQGNSNGNKFDENPSSYLANMSVIRDISSSNSKKSMLKFGIRTSVSQEGRPVTVLQCMPNIQEDHDGYEMEMERVSSEGIASSVTIGSSDDEEDESTNEYFESDFLTPSSVDKLVSDKLTDIIP